MTAEAVSAAAQPGPGQIPGRVAQPQAPPARRAHQPQPPRTYAKGRSPDAR